MALPKSHEFGPTWNPPSSDQTAANGPDSGQVEATIKHDPIAGVTTNSRNGGFRILAHTVKEGS